MLEWIAVGVVLVIAIWLVWRSRRRNYTVSPGHVTITGSGLAVVDRVKKFKDRCLGAR